MSSENNSFRNKYILVTGANQGTGFEIAKEFILSGALVAVHHYQDEAGARKLLQYAKPGQCTFFQADFSQEKEVSKLWQEFILWSKEKIDVLVNNAAAFGKSDEDWNMVFQVNTKAPFLLMNYAFPFMLKQKSGRIINMSSISVKSAGSLGVARYSASKAALEALTQLFARTGREDNVFVNAVRPGVTDSPLHHKLAECDPLFATDKFISTKEIADAVVTLASGNSTGSIVEVIGE